MSIPEAEKWPMVADSARPETVSHMRKNGFPKIQSAVKGAKSVEDGIEWLKSFDIVVHPRCKHVIDEMTLYSFKTDQMTGKVLPVLADRDNHCIAEGELVTCERGLIPIEQVTTSDKVLTRGGFQRVLFADVTDINRETLIVETTNGIVRCTPDHEIWTAKGFVRADALRYGDEVLTLEQSSWSKFLSGMERGIGAIQTAFTRLTKHTSSAAKRMAQAGFTGMFGRMSMVQSPTAGTFTTLMGTQQTTTYPIWNASAPRNMQSAISGAMNASSAKKFTWPTSESLPKHGTLLMRAGRNTKKSVRWLMQRLFQSLNRASNAVLFSHQTKQGTGTSFAPTNASLHGAEHQVWTMRKDAAKVVGNHSQPTNTAAHATVRGHVLTVRDGGQCAKVYDLTVENHHEFFVNGVLVSNCIDAVRYALEGARRANVQQKPKARPVVTMMPMAR
jgi:hypothetical protein